MSDESTCDKSIDVPNFWHAKYTELWERGNKQYKLSKEIELTFE